MMVNYKDRKTIYGKDKEAFDEFLAGKERWNVYVGKHGDDTEVDFSCVDFSKHRKGKGEFNFSEYRFPKEGYVNFRRSIFGDGGVNFTYANFGLSVSFMEAKFGKGNVNFSCAQLGTHLGEFKSTTFGEGEVNFNSATFGTGEADFIDAQFGKGNVYFCNVNFGERQARHATSQHSGTPVTNIHSPTQRMGDALVALRPSQLRTKPCSVKTTSNGWTAIRNAILASLARY